VSIFGTDGVRGPAGVGPLSAQGALSLAAAYGATLRAEGDDGSVVIARDTRESGAMLAAAVSAGLSSAGVAVVDLGVLPTPALSWWLHARPEHAGGVMITASHNPWQDNGLKLFAAGGGKSPDRVQQAAEHRVGAPVATAAFGGVSRRDVLEPYLASLGAPGRPLAGLTVVADSAAGAAWRALPSALANLGAEVLPGSPEPNGRNINEGWGAVHPGALAAEVVRTGAWAGVALDGDGDRVTLVDQEGEVHDGDAILGFLAAEMQSAGVLPGDVVVGTVTTNSGLERFLSARGISLLRSDVGDRHVAALMAESGARLGGESSGHVLTPDTCPTGDGLRVALDVLVRVASRGESLSATLGVVPRDPSAKRSVRVGSRPPIDSVAPLASLMREADVALSAAGARQLLRYSGTEPVLRIQVEGPQLDLVERWADRLAACVRDSIPTGD